MFFQAKFRLKLIISNDLNSQYLQLNDHYFRIFINYFSFNCSFNLLKSFYCHSILLVYLELSNLDLYFYLNIQAKPSHYLKNL